MKFPILRCQYINGRNKISALIDRYLFQIALWALWTFVVMGAAFYQWHYDVVRHLPFNILGMVIHSVVVGVIGMVVITYIEIRLNPDVTDSSI